MNYSNHLNSCYLLPSPTYLSLTLIWYVVPCDCFHQELQRWLSLIQELPWLSLTPECVRRLLCKKDSEPGTCSPCRPFPTRQIRGSGSNQPDFGAFYFWINPHVSSQECQTNCPNAPVGFVQNGVPPNPFGWLIDFTPLPRIQRASDWQPPKAAIGFTCSCCNVWEIYGNRFYRKNKQQICLWAIMNLGTRIKEDNWLSTVGREKKLVHSDLSPPSPWCAQVVQHEHLHPEKDAMTHANFKYPSVIKHGNGKFAICYEWGLNWMRKLSIKFYQWIIFHCQISLDAQKGQGKVNCLTFGPSFRRPRARFELVPASGSFGWDTWCSFFLGQPLNHCDRPWKSIAAFISMAIVNEYHGISPPNMAKYGQKYGTVMYSTSILGFFGFPIDHRVVWLHQQPHCSYRGLSAAVLVEMIQLLLQEHRLIHLASCAQCVLIKQWMYDHSPMGKISTDEGYHHGYTHL